MKYLHTSIQHYWNRYQLEYLNKLREHHRYGKEEDTNKCRWYCTFWRSYTETKLLEIKKNHQTYQGSRWKRAATVKIYNNSIHQLLNRAIKLYPLETSANENIEKDEIITDQAIVDNDMTSSYELSQWLNRLAADTSILIRRLSGLWAGVNSLTYSFVYGPTC